MFFIVSTEKCNPNFLDNIGTTCQEYLDGEMCTSSGGYGFGWSYTFGKDTQYTFEHYSKNGETVLVCPQCGCGSM